MSQDDSMLDELAKQIKVEPARLPKVNEVRQRANSTSQFLVYTLKLAQIFGFVHCVVF